VLKMAEPIDVANGKKTMRLEVSLGTADYTSAEGLEDSIQLADEAMYRQKHARKSPERGMRALPVPPSVVGA
jgi:PleD family two-component response regulator